MVVGLALARAGRVAVVVSPLSPRCELNTTMRALTTELDGRMLSDTPIRVRVEVTQCDVIWYNVAQCDAI